MTSLILQQLLVEKVKELFKNFKLKNEKGNLVSLNIYPQSLPAKKGKKDESHFPYIIAKLMDGSTNDKESKCKVAFIIGTYDDEDTYQGYKDVLNIIEKIRDKLLVERYYKQFQLTYPLDWVVHDEDTYPFYFGAVETNWIVATPPHLLEGGENFYGS